MVVGHCVHHDRGASTRARPQRQSSSAWRPAARGRAAFNSRPRARLRMQSSRKHDGVQTTAIATSTQARTYGMSECISESVQNPSTRARLEGSRALQQKQRSPRVDCFNSYRIANLMLAHGLQLSCSRSSLFRELRSRSEKHGVSPRRIRGSRLGTATLRSRPGVGASPRARSGADTPVRVRRSSCPRTTHGRATWVACGY